VNALTRRLAAGRCPQDQATDSNGRFRIDYSSADFELTPFSPYINIEWVGGPDLYFKATLGS
jgi:hypothetical protein